MTGSAEREEQAMGDNSRKALSWRPTMFLALLAAASFAVTFAYGQWGLPFLVRAVAESKLTDQFWFTLLLPKYILLFGGAGLLIAAAVSWRVPVSRWRAGAWFPWMMLLAVLLRFVTPNTAMNTAPKPDGIQYTLLSMQLVKQGSFLLLFGPHRLPSRMPPGPALAMTPTQWLRPNEPGYGIYSIWIFSLLTLWLVYRIGLRAGGPTAGRAAAALLALSPMHIHYSRQLMGEIPWAFCVLASLYLLVDPSRRKETALAGGALFGLSILFKPPHLMILIGVGLSLALLWLFRDNAWRRRALLFLLAAGCGSLTWLAYNQTMFGDWRLTGYHVFSPEYYAGKTPSLAWSYAWSRPLYGGRFGNVLYYGLAFLGLDPRPERMIWPPPAMLFFIAALVFCRRTPGEPWRREFFIAAASGGGCLGLLLLFYCFQDPRFFLALAPLLFLYAGGRMAPLWARLPVAIRNLTMAILTLYMAAALLAEVRVEQVHPRTNERELWTKLGQAVEGYEAIVTDADPALLTFYNIWTAGRRIIPSIAPGDYCLADDPAATFREHHVFAAPYPGTVAAVKAELAARGRVAVWLRHRHYNAAAYDLFHETFAVVPRPETGVPGFGEVSGFARTP